MSIQHHELHSTANPAAVLAALRAELREWRESVLPPALRWSGVLQVTGTVEGHAFVLRYDVAGVKGRPLDDVELRGRLSEVATGTRVAIALHHSNGLETMLVVWTVVLAAFGWFSVAGALVVLVFGACMALHAWWEAHRASRLVPLQRRHLLDRLEHALRVAEQAHAERRESAG